MNDSLYVKGYTIVENFFTKQQVDFYMSQVVEEMSLNRLHLAADIENEEKLHPATWNVNSNPIWQNTMYSFLSSNSIPLSRFHHNANRIPVTVPHHHQF